MQVQNKAKLKWGGGRAGAGNFPLKILQQPKLLKNGIHRERIKQVFLLSWIVLALYPDPRWTKQKRNLNNSRIPKFKVSSMYAFFRFLAKIIQYPHSFSLMTFLYRSIHYQPTTQVIGRKFRVSSIQEYSMSARVQNRTTRILRLQNVICEPRCFACNA